MIRALVALSVIACTFVAAPSGADDTNAAIGARTAAWTKAWNAGDAAALSRMYTSDGMLLPPNSRAVNGRAAIEKFWAGDVDDQLTVALESREIEPLGDGSAYEIGAYTVSNADGDTVDTGKYVVIWRRDGKEWYLRRDIWNSDRAAHASAPSTPSNSDG